jgi:monofunctional biosynthetic peptidoglycan transglycosylase
VVLAVAVVGALRFVNPPTTAFIVGARLDAWRGGESLTVHQQWLPPMCLANSSRLAVMAAEDQKFASHRGFDMDQIADALTVARQGGRVRGASTLSQQTVKNLFLWPGQSWLRKGLEAALTLLVETLWPKQRVLEMYLNVAEFGPGVYGVEAAAGRYFGKPAVHLNEAESALLAAVLPNPRVLHVDAPSDFVRDRQRWILRHMSSVKSLPGVTPLLLPATDRCPLGD